jgi:amidase
MAVGAIPPWQERAKNKQSRILSGVPAQFIHDDLVFSETDTASVQDVPDKLLSPLEKEITSLKAEELVPALAARAYTAVQVLDAFTHRAAVAHKLLHCCLEFCYSAARARASQLDQFLAETGKTVGPLHGLPISVKDQCRMVGTETTCGFICNLGTKDTQNCVLVDILQRAGAIPFVKTNLSVGCMWGETVNQ